MDNHSSSGCKNLFAMKWVEGATLEKSFNRCLWQCLTILPRCSNSTQKAVRRYSTRKFDASWTHRDSTLGSICQNLSSFCEPRKSIVWNFGTSSLNGRMSTWTDSSPSWATILRRRIGNGLGLECARAFCHHANRKTKMRECKIN